jgi:hypothetical protein
MSLQIGLNTFKMSKKARWIAWGAIVRRHFWLTGGTAENIRYGMNPRSFRIFGTVYRMMQASGGKF